MKPTRTAICAITLMVLAADSSAPQAQPAEDDEAMQNDRALAIHEAVMTIDSHDDIPPNFATEAVDPLDARRQVNLQKMRAGGLDAAFFIVYVGQTRRTPDNYAKAQADAIVASLASRGVPHVYHVYVGEGHGWRKAETITHFYGAVEAFLRQHVLFA